MKGNYKVPGGKLLKVEFEVSEDTITSFSLTGDFFLYPEDGVDLINKSLQGCKLDKAEIEAKLAETMSSNNLKPVGFTPSDLATAIMQIMEEK